MFQIGDTVLYKFNADDGDHGYGRPGTQAPATVTHVWSESCVNLRVLTDSAAMPPHKRSVSLGTGEGQFSLRGAPAPAAAPAPRAKPAPLAPPDARAAPDPMAAEPKAPAKPE